MLEEKHMHKLHQLSPLMAVGVETMTLFPTPGTFATIQKTNSHLGIFIPQDPHHLETKLAHHDYQQSLAVLTAHFSSLGLSTQW